MRPDNDVVFNYLTLRDFDVHIPNIKDQCYVFYRPTFFIKIKGHPLVLHMVPKNR